MGKVRELLRDGCRPALVRQPENIHSDAAAEVDVFLPVCAPNKGTLAGDDLQRETAICMRNILRI